MDERDQHVEQEEAENSAEDQKKVVQDGCYMKAAGQKLFIPVELEGSNNPKGGQERDVGDHCASLPVHPSKKEKGEEKRCYAQAKEEDTF